MAGREVFVVLPVVFFWNFQRMKNYHNNGLLVESMQLIGALPSFSNSKFSGGSLGSTHTSEKKSESRLSKYIKTNSALSN